MAAMAGHINDFTAGCYLLQSVKVIHFDARINLRPKPRQHKAQASNHRVCIVSRYFPKKPLGSRFRDFKAGAFFQDV